jgi:hypothetical protein
MAHELDVGLFWYYWPPMPGFPAKYNCAKKQ